MPYPPNYTDTDTALVSPEDLRTSTPEDPPHRQPQRRERSNDRKSHASNHVVASSNSRSGRNVGRPPLKTANRTHGAVMGRVPGRQMSSMTSRVTPPTNNIDKRTPAMSLPGRNDSSGNSPMKSPRSPRSNSATATPQKGSNTPPHGFLARAPKTRGSISGPPITPPKESADSTKETLPPAPPNTGILSYFSGMFMPEKAEDSDSMWEDETGAKTPKARLSAAEKAADNATIASETRRPTLVDGVDARMSPMGAVSDRMTVPVHQGPKTESGWDTPREYNGYTSEAPSNAAFNTTYGSTYESSPLYKTDYTPPFSPPPQSPRGNGYNSPTGNGWISPGSAPSLGNGPSLYVNGNRSSVPNTAPTLSTPGYHSTMDSDVFACLEAVASATVRQSKMSYG